MSARLLDSLENVHYVDSGLNCRGVHITDPTVVQWVAARCKRGHGLPHITLHGTPRQWGEWAHESASAMQGSICVLTRQCAARCCYFSFSLSSFICSCFHADLFHFIAAAADDPHRPWICIEKNRFKALCVEAGVPITERRYFSDVRPPSLLMHFDIIQELCVEEGTGEGGPAPQG